MKEKHVKSWMVSSIIVNNKRLEPTLLTLKIKNEQ